MPPEAVAHLQSGIEIEVAAWKIAAVDGRALGGDPAIRFEVGALALVSRTDSF